LIGAIHALFIALLTVPAFVFLMTKPNAWKFASSRHLNFCSVDESTNVPGIEGSQLILQAVAVAGLAFTAFTVADVGISILHRLATWDFIVHHVAFISAGLMIRSHCMLPFNAAILLAMEVSTPFLNYLLFFRHRGETYESVVKTNGVVFVLLYVVFRLGFNSYGFIVLCVNKFNAVPSGVADWEVWFLLVAIGAGVAVQIFWLPLICRAFLGAGLGICPSKPRQPGSSDEGDSSAEAVEDGCGFCGMTGENAESDVEISGTELMSAEQR